MPATVRTAAGTPTAGNGPVRTVAGRAIADHRFSLPVVRELPPPPRSDDAGLW